MRGREARRPIQNSGSLYREFNEGNARIRDMIDLLVGADREDRINFVQGSQG